MVMEPGVTSGSPCQRLLNVPGLTEADALDLLGRCLQLPDRPGTPHPLSASAQQRKVADAST